MPLVEPGDASKTAKEGRPAKARRSLSLHEGTEPDYRFSMANERTFLAWVRTALALLAAAVALTQLTSNVHPELRRVLGIMLTMLALVISAVAYPRWAANQRAMRLGAPLPIPRLLPAVCAVLLLIAVGVLIDVVRTL